MVERHTHNGTDSPRIEFTDLDILGSALIQDPSGGSTIDVEVRTAVSAILALLKEKGLMKQS